MSDKITVHNFTLTQDKAIVQQHLGPPDRTFTLTIRTAHRGSPAVILALSEAVARKLFDDLQAHKLKPLGLGKTTKLS